MSLKFIDTKSGNAGGTVTLNTARTSMPGEHVVRCIAQVQLTMSAGNTQFDARAWGLASYLKATYRDNAVLCPNISLATLDFLARENKQGLNRNGLDCDDRTGQTSAAQEIWIELPLSYFKLRDPLDAIFPVDELGDFQVTISTAGISVGTLTGFTVNLWAETVSMSTPHLGLRSIYGEFNLDASGLLNIPFDGNLPLNVIIAQTALGGSIAAAVPGGFALTLDGKQVVDGVQAITIERADGLFGEPVYAQQDGVAPGSGTGVGPWSSYTASALLARIFRQSDAQSLVGIPFTVQGKFQAFGPGASVATCRIAYRALVANTDALIAQRRSALGLPPMVSKRDQDDASKSIAPGDRAKLPSRLMTV